MLASSYPRWEGDIAGTFVRSLATHLVQAGHEVHVLRPDDGPIGTIRQSIQPEGVFEHVFPYAPHSSLRLLGYAKSLRGDRTLDRLAYAMILPYLLSGYVRLRQLAGSVGFDAIHAHWVLPNGPIAAAVAQALRIPLVITLHGSDVYVAERNRVFRSVAGWVFQRAAMVTTCSDNLRQRAILLGADRATARTIPNGASPGIFDASFGGAPRVRRDLGIGQSDPMVLALGRLVSKKGFEFLLESFPRVLEVWPNAKLVLAGDGLLMASLRAQAAGLGIADSLRMPGQVAWTDVPALMAAADIFVMPSVTDDSGNVDGLPTVVLEAMAARKAVIATRVGGLPEVIVDGENGLLVDERSPDAIAVAIRRLLDDPGARESFGRQARQLIEDRLNWVTIADEFARVYRAAALDKRAPPVTGSPSV